MLCHVVGPTPPADETVGLLVNAGMFDSAINICRLYEMPFTTVFDGLASRSVNGLVSRSVYVLATLTTRFSEEFQQLVFFS